MLPALTALLLVAAAVPSLATPPARDRVVVTFVPGTTRVERSAALDGAEPSTKTQPLRFGALSAHASPPWVVTHVTPSQRAELSADPRVLAVDEDLPTSADGVVPAQPGAVDAAAIAAPRDPAWPEQDGLRRIRANDVWETTTGERDVVIAVVDTGVDPTTPDLRGRVVSGYDFVQRDVTPTDDNGHGTAVATMVAAASDTFGVAGLCWQCRIMPVKVLDETGNGYLSDAASGIAWAVDHGADIVNVSLGAPGTMIALDSALQAAERAGVLVVASTGNAGNTVKQWPAADPRTLSVAALDENDRRADYSTYGDWVDVAAPGCNPAGWLRQEIVMFCGTSSATPLATGSAALLASARGGVSGGDLHAVLQTSAISAGAGVGAGRIDALAALQALPVFIDIAGTVHEANITRLAQAEVTDGCGDDRYCPSRKITRGQFATFLDRALVLPHATANFADVPAGHPHAAGIAAVAAADITRGCGGRNFCPASGLTRGQMASLLARALHLPDGTATFHDVPPGHPHAQGIGAIAARGITSGCATGRFCPGTTVTRGQMASFLVRALDL